MGVTMPRSVRLAAAMCALLPAMADAAPPSSFAAPFGDIAPDAPGCAFAAVQAGRAPVSGGFGLADIASGRPFTDHPVFDAAPLSKHFTHFVILSLLGTAHVRTPIPIAHICRLLHPA